MIPSVRKRKGTGGRLGLGMIGAATALGLAGLMVWKVPPGGWGVEAAVITMIWGGLFVAGAWITGRKKWSFIVSAWVVGVLLMRRWGVLDWPMVGLWVLVLGVVSLVN